jgi:hypothetical protein
MSFFAESDRIRVTKDGVNVFDTNERMLYIHTEVNIDFTLPALPLSEPPVKTSYHIFTLPVAADFIIGYRNSLDGDNSQYAINGGFLSEVMGDGVISRTINVMRFVSIELAENKRDIVANVVATTRAPNGVPEKRYNLTIYAGNYDL